MQGGGTHGIVAPPPDSPAAGSQHVFQTLLGHLFRRALLAAHQEYYRRIGQAGISPLQFGLLNVIAHDPGVSQAALAEALHAAPSVITTGLKRLLAEGLVTRGRARDDGRRVEFRLTKEGQREHARLHAEVEAVERALRDKAGPDQGAALDAALRAFLEAAETGPTVALPEASDA